MNRPGGGEVTGAGVDGAGWWAATKSRILGYAQASALWWQPWQGWPHASGPAFRSLGPWVGQFRPGCKVQLGARPATGGEAPALRGRCPSWQD